ncbi:hypothetical protein [Macrococcus capreoli]|uniref:hypothetical protein n=1 Tax=Macrococcus capreoli TaxID=2982690 RepID=UPI003F426313
MNLTISDDVIKELVKEEVSHHLSDYKMDLFTIDIKKLAELTSLSEKTLTNKITSQPEFVEVTRRVGTRVLYLYPECMTAYRKILERRYSS